MYDPEFDGELPKKALVELAAEPTKPPRSFRTIPAKLLGLWPIPRLAQAVFAESFRQALLERMPVDQAIRLASEVNPSRRFQQALKRMAVQVRSGYPLDTALARSGIRPPSGLMASLKVGEQHGQLADEMGAFARRTRGFSSRRFFQAIGRTDEAIDFAAALARLLVEQRLTVTMVRAAGEVSAAGRPRFATVISDIASEIENGRSLVECLSRHPRRFDPLYREFLAAANSREEMRACLTRLGARH
jgi:type II secretory pathway component PulF